MTTRVCLVLLVLSATIRLNAEELLLEPVIRVSTGHILKLESGQLVAIYGVICASTTTPKGKAAHDFTADFLKHGDTEITVVTRQFDVTYVKAKNSALGELNTLLLRKGYGVIDTLVAYDDDELAAAAAEYREQDPSPTPLSSQSVHDKQGDNLREFQERMAAKAQARIDAWNSLMPDQQQAYLEAKERKDTEAGYCYTQRLAGSCTESMPTVVIINNENDDVVIKMCGPTPLTLVVPYGQSVQVNATPGVYIPVWKVGYGSFAEYRAALQGLSTGEIRTEITLNASDGNTGVQNITAGQFAGY